MRLYIDVDFFNGPVNGLTPLCILGMSRITFNHKPTPAHASYNEAYTNFHASYDDTFTDT